MTPRNIIEEFDRRGMALAANGDRLLVGGPKGGLTDELRDVLRSHKTELLALLAEPPIPPPSLVVASDTRPSPEWDEKLLGLIEWFRSAELPDEPFTLRPGVRVAEPLLWYARIEADISGGPETPRALYGALQADLRTLWERFGPAPEGPGG